MPLADPIANRAYQREWQQSRRDVGQGSRVTLDAKIAWLREQKDAPCTDCGRRFHYCVMDFDHVRGEKLGHINTILRTRGFDALRAEVAKCELVCANCHRTRTFQRGGYQR